MKRGRQEEEEDDELLFKSWFGVEEVPAPKDEEAEAEEEDHLLDALRELSKLKPDEAEERGEVEDDDDDADASDEEEEQRELHPQLRVENGDYLDFRLASSHPYAKEAGRLWKRPAAPAISGKEDFVMQHVETTYGIENTIPVLKIWGCTREGHSVLVQTTSFKPYFFVDVSDMTEMIALRERMEAHLKKLKWKDRVPLHILSIEPVERRSMCGYHRNRPLSTMFKVTVAQPGYVSTLRDCLEKVNQSVTNRAIRTFEGNVPFELRAMVDSNLAGCQWLRLKAGSYEVQDAEGSVNVQYKLSPLEGLQGITPIPIGEMDDLAPMRYLSFDIEAKREKPGFCKAEEDDSILICCALDVIGTGIIHQVIFAFVPNEHQTVKPIKNATIYVFRDERLMLLAFSQYIRETDPDAFTGWNITGFDWPYLFGRAKALGIFDEFVKFTRVTGKKAWMRSQVFKSKAYGAKKNNELLCEGRFDYDGLIFMLRGQMTKYRSYKLNAISKEVLDDQKVEVDYTQIPALHNGSDEDRTRLAWYCLKDALLPLELLNKLMAVINGIEQSRVTGVPIKWLLSRGQGVKTFSNILRYKEPCEVVPSRSPKTSGVFTAGGDVREPLRGFYDHPLATLDFSSLYPSIMQAYNICYSTVESLAWAKANLKEGDYWIVEPLDGKTPNDFVFVKKHIREGVLPRLLTALLNQRAYVKNLMKKVDPIKDKRYYNVLDGRQLALKVVCNSVYGFLKAFILTDPRLMAAVTAYGRMMIVKTANLIESKYKDNMIVDRAACEALGLDYEKEPSSPEEVDPRPRKKYSARIIYGVSDDFFLFCFSVSPLQKGHGLGHC